MYNDEKYQQSLSFWTMAFYYLNISEAVFKKTIETNNAWVILDDNPIDENKYHEKTQFSDFNVMVPSLFNFYHSIELILKGFLIIKNDIKPNHKIEELYTDFISNYPEQSEIIDILNKYILLEKMIEPIKTFFIDNRISANQFYEALRYPLKKDFVNKYEHIELKYKESDSILFFKETVENIIKLKHLYVKLGRSLKE